MYKSITTQRLSNRHSVFQYFFLKPSHNFLLRIFQRPLTPKFPTPHLVYLCERESPCFYRGVISQTCLLRHYLTLHLCGLLSVRPLVYCNDRRASQTQVMLKCNICAGDKTVVCPSAELPDEFGTLCNASCT